MCDFGLQDDAKTMMLNILKTYPQIEEATLFGSRARNTYKVTSDIDLAIKGQGVHSIMAALIDDFEESDLIYEVDVLDYNNIASQALLGQIDKGGQVFYRKGWVETTLGEVVERVTKGTTPKCFSTNKDDINYIKSDALGYNGRLNIEKFLKVTPQVHEQLKRSQLKENDILLSMAGAFLGKTGLVTKEMLPANTNQAAAIISTNINVICYTYLWYKLRDKKTVRYFNAIPSQSAQPNINFTEIKSLPICLPPLPEQKAIANMLSSFDDKIELLREQNKILEILAQTIFKEWFVHFNFPDPHGKPYRNNGGAMVASELGEIPQGWRVGKLGEEFNITIGRTPPRKEQHWFSKIPIGKKWSSIKDIVNSGMYLFETSEYITDDAISKFNIPVIPENTVILSFKMTVGKLAITTEDMLSNEAIAHMKIKPDSYFISEYIYLFLHGLDFNSLGSTSSIVTAINSTMIKQIQLLVPDEEVIGSFSEVMKPIFEKVKNNSSQIQSLSKTRDTLLPKLMSGQVRVKA